MLDKHLIAVTNGKAQKENVVLWKDYRVTVLLPRLFRVERNEKHVWRDAATQSVWFRNMPAQNFRATAGEDELRIVTDGCTLIVKKERADMRVVLDGKELPVSNEGNLGGTCRTLDRCNGNKQYNLHPDGVWRDELLKIEDGVCSRSGVALFDDAPSLTLGEDGKIHAERGEGSDEYIFAFGHDYRGAVRALYAVTGQVPLVPKYALGNWWCRYYAYSDEDLLTLLEKFTERELPLSALVIDMDWHYSDDVDKEVGITEKGRNTEFYGGNYGWTGYTWNKNLFPDYKAFLQELNGRGMHVSLNLHPADGVRWWEDCYEDMAKATGIDPASGQQVRFDITNDDFLNNYFSKIHKPYERDGVGFWWIDWQQGTTSAIAGLDPLWSLNHYHYLDHASNHYSPLILSRYGGIGSHRYPVGFSGDTDSTWETNAYLPYFTSRSTNAGYTWWSHDVGGHFCGITDGEMYARNVQFCLFSPVMRFHCGKREWNTREPWHFGNGAGAAVEECMRFRHSMIPFLYTANYKMHAEGRALVEPIYYEHDCEQAYTYQQNEYLFGGLLVAPVVTPRNGDGYARVRAWLPHGRWTDIFTGEEYDVREKEGRETSLYRRLESIPVLAAAGTVLPLSRDKQNGVANPEKLEVRVYAGNGSYTLYEDNRYRERGEEYRTEFVVRQKGKEVTLTVSGKGDTGVVPKNRTLCVCFADIYKGSVQLFVNGKKQKIKRDHRDCVALTFAYEDGNEYVLAAVDEETAFARVMRQTVREIRLAEEKNNIKDAMLAALAACKSKEEVIAVIKYSDCKDMTKTKIFETLW